MNKENLECSRQKTVEILDYMYSDETLNNGDVAELDNFKDEIHND